MTEVKSEKKCPYCAEMIAAEAVCCRYCGSQLGKRAYLDVWTRPRRGQKIAGVCAGIARRFDLDVVFVRFAFVVAAFIGGFGVLLYLVLWFFLMPRDKEENASGSI